MKYILLIVTALALAGIARAQDKLPEYGTIDDIKNLTKIYVTADDDGVRSTIVGMLHGYERLQAVNSTKEAEIVLEYTTLTRDVAANRGPGAVGASMALRSQMRASVLKGDGDRLIAWSKTETYNVTNGFVLGASNEVNLTHHFIEAIQKARGEKTSSMRQLFKTAQQYKKDEKKKKP